MQIFWYALFMETSLVEFISMWIVKRKLQDSLHDHICLTMNRILYTTCTNLQACDVLINTNSQPACDVTVHYHLGLQRGKMRGQGPGGTRRESPG